MQRHKTMRMKLNLYIIFSILTSPLFAQNAQLTGKVTDENGQAIQNANIVADASRGLVTISDSAGNYRLPLPAGNYEMTFHYTGKNERKIKVMLTENEVTELNVALLENVRLMDEVVITGSRYEKKLSEETVSMDVMKGPWLTDQNITGVDQSMALVPGVTIADGQVNIRGGGGWSYGAGSRAQVLMDDLPILSADASDAKWEIIPVENIDQVEVIKGAGSALYGTGALDGIVNVRTAWPTDTAYAKVTLYGGLTGPPTRTPSMDWWGTDDPTSEGASFAYRQKLGQSDLVLGGAYNGGTGYLDSSDSHSFRGNIKYRYRFKHIAGLNIGVNASAYYGYGKTFFFWKGIDSLAYQPYPGTVSIAKTYRFTIDPFIDYTDRNDNHFRFQGRFLDSQNDNNTGQGSVPIQYYSELQYRRRLVTNPFDLNFIAGVVNVYNNVTPPPGESGSLFGKNTSYNFSAYAQTDFKFFKRLSISLGARWEYIEMNHYVQDSAASGGELLVNKQNSLQSLPYPIFRAGLNYQAAEATYIRASFGQGFRYPSIAERFISTTVGPLTIASNPNLQPEKGYSAEIGIKQGFKLGGTWSGYADASGFMNMYNDMIEFTFGQFGSYANWTNPAADYGFGFSSQNIGKAMIAGSELELAGEGKIGPLDVILLAGYTYQDPRSLNWNGKLLMYNYQDSLLTNQGTAGAAYNQANNPKNLNYITYAQTSSSTTNVLKYTSRHLIKANITLGWKGIEWNSNVQFSSFQQNIDYAFVSPVFQLLDQINHTSAFTGLLQYRTAKQNTPIGEGRGDIVWNMYAAYKFKQGVRIAFLVNNVLNWEYTPRPAYFASPRNYTLQLSYTFKGKGPKRRSS